MGSEEEALASQVEDRLREQALAELPPDSRAGVATMGLDELLHVWGIWRDRQVPRRPRTAHVSNELRTGSRGQRYRAILDAVVEKVEAGEDLSPHLSRSARVAFVPSSGIRKGKEHLRDDRDLLLSDWGIHHLHLSTEVGQDGLVRRTRDLLFVVFRPDDAYLIGIYPHAKWAPLDALETIVRNWPDANLLMSPLSGLRLTQTYTDDERLKLRNGGMTGAVEIDGTVYMPRGQALDHAPMEIMRRVMGVRHALTQLRDGELSAVLAEDEDWWDARFGPPPIPCWRAAIHDNNIGLIREAHFLRLAPLP